MIQSPIIIPPERYFQREPGTQRNIVDTFKRIVNIIMERQREMMIRSGLLYHFSSMDQKSMIGSIGKTQGARTVRSHARNARRARVINIGFYRNNTWEINDSS